MIEPFNYRGMWWSPTHKRRVPGELTFSPDDGIHLTVQGNLSKRHSSDRMEHYPILLGRAEYGGHNSQVALFDTWVRTSVRSGSPRRRITVETLRVRHALLGAHLRTKEEWQFHSAEIEYHLLDDWVDEYGFEVEVITEPYTVTYQWSEAPPARVPGGVVKIGRMVSQPWGYSHELNLKEHLRFDVTFDEPVDVEALHSSWLYPLQNLLTLSMHQPSWLTAVRLFNRRFKYRNGRHPRPLTLVYMQGYRPRPDVKAPHFSNMLLRYSDVKDRLGDSLSGWFKALSDLKPFADVFFGDRYHPATFGQSRLLTLALAVEALHRNTMSNSLRPKDEFRRIVSEVVSAAPDQHRQWLKQQLTYSNEPRLRDRIFQLCERFEVVMAPLVEDLREFAAYTARLRNDIVHGNQRSKITGSDVYWTVRKLEILCEAFLLSSLGFSSSQLRELFERNEDYRVVRAYGKGPSNSAVK